MKKSEDKSVRSGELVREELPQVFNVRELGGLPAGGLWGIRHTRGPVDKLVAGARPPGQNHTPAPAPLTVSSEGVRTPSHHFPIASVSYGVQDLVYTRVFAMIVVAPPGSESPFRCHAFVCESRAAARRLTYCLATAFQEYSDRVGPSRSLRGLQQGIPPPKFAIDLRTPEEIAKEQDSEA